MHGQAPWSLDLQGAPQRLRLPPRLQAREPRKQVEGNTGGPQPRCVLALAAVPVSQYSGPRWVVWALRHPGRRVLRCREGNVLLRGVHPEKGTWSTDRLSSALVFPSSQPPPFSLCGCVLQDPVSTVQAQLGAEECKRAPLT